MPEDRSDRLAVLIDADNASSQIADGLFEEIAKIGEASVRRIYGDFAAQRMKGWASVLSRTRSSRSSNSPTRPARTPPTSRSSSTRWISCTAAASTASAWCRPTAISPASPRASASRAPTSTASASRRRRRAFGRPAAVSSTRRTFCRALLRSTRTRRSATRFSRPARSLPILRKVISQIDSEDGWVPLSVFGKRLANLAPDFDSRTYGYKKLSDLVRKIGAFDVEQAEGGGLRVRLKTAPAAEA